MKSIILKIRKNKKAEEKKNNLSLKKLIKDLQKTKKQY